VPLAVFFVANCNGAARARVHSEGSMASEASSRAAIPPRPASSIIDVDGLTHQGHKRSSNADHFLIGSFHRLLRVHATSLPEDIGPRESEWRGFILLVADGVGGLSSASDGSAQALTTVAQDLLHASEACSEMAMWNQDDAMDSLREAILHAHDALRGERDGSGSKSATTLTMFAVFWPIGFVIHVGDSRLYRLRGDDFQCLTTDQTMAEVMVEAGAMSREEADKSALKHVLWSAVGASEISPEVVVTDVEARDIVLLCTDGLTKHVTEDEIREAMKTRKASREMCSELVQLALDRGGTDNVTVVVGQTRQPLPE
jgi:serine/threonine protein phosphatase PrpC